MTNMNENRRPAVSIIIPAYNTANLIPNCLNSVLAQTYSDFEAIVVNDGSPDTPELETALARYLNRIVYIKQENKRAAGARNTAIRQARGEFLAFLDSDDIWFPDHLASQMKLFQDDPTLDMVYSDALLMGDPRGRRFMEKCPSAGAATFEALAEEKCHIPISTVVARKQAIVSGGLFDEGLLRCDDFDMWLRAAFRGAKIGYSREVGAKLNGGRPGSLGESRAKMAEAYWVILDKAIRTLPLDGTQHDRVAECAADIRARYLVEEAKCHLSEGRFDKARQLLSEANKGFPRPKLSLAVLGLAVAPNLTSKLIIAWMRIVRTVPISATRT